MSILSYRWWLSGVVLVSPLCAVSADKEKSTPKNILFIVVDDLKPLIGAYGDPIAQTPHIDELARRGTLFSGSYCQQAVSGPTRASVLTGWCPDKTKVWDLKTQIRDMNPDVVTMPQYLKSMGYTTAGIGKVFDGSSVDTAFDALSWSVPFISYENYYDSQYAKPALGDFQSPQNRKLVEEYREEALRLGVADSLVERYVAKHIRPATESANVGDGAYSDGAIAAGAMEFLNRYRSSKPFFLAVGFKRPHLPFCAPQKYWELYDRSEIPLASFRKRAEGSPTFAYHTCGELQAYSDIPPLFSFNDTSNVVIPDEKARELIHGYYASVSYVDAQIGKVLECLRKKGLDKNTIIVLWGDHGWHLGDHGLWNKHSNFENATRAPLIIADPGIKPSVVSGPVEFLDIYPTICDLSGVSTPSDLDGISLVELMKNPYKSLNRKPYAVSQFPRNGKLMGYSIRDSRFRYTVWVEWKNRISNVSRVVDDELYDYMNDPLETKNLADEVSYRSSLSKMKMYWNDYIKRRITLK